METYKPNVEDKGRLVLLEGDPFSWHPDYIDQLCRFTQTDLFIIDSLSASLGSETLNSDSVVRNVFTQVKKLRDRCKATILIVAHTGKNISREMMGSAVLINDADTAIKVNGARKKLITLKKQRNGSKENKSINFMPYPVHFENDVKNLYIDFDSAKVGLDHDQSLIMDAYRSFEKPLVSKADIKRVWLSYLYPSGIVPNNKKDALRTKFNRKTNQLVDSEALHRFDNDMFSEDPIPQ